MCVFICAIKIIPYKWGNVLRSFMRLVVAWRPSADAWAWCGNNSDFIAHHIDDENIQFTTIYVYMYINTSYIIYICANTHIPHIQLQFAALIKQKPTTVVAITTDIWMNDRDRIENQINNTHKLSHAVCMYIYEYSVYIWRKVRKFYFALCYSWIFMSTCWLAPRFGRT